MDSVPYLLERDVFSDKELHSIFHELKWLMDKMLPPRQTDGASRDGKIIKSNKGVNLGNIYGRRIDDSSIFKLCGDKVSNSLLEYSEKHITNRGAMCSNNMWVLVSYYEDGDYYSRHRDATNDTALFWFNEKEFSGGDLTFDDTDEIIKYKSNSMIIFPNWADHSVSKVSGEGRYCVTVGLHIVPK